MSTLWVVVLVVVVVALIGVLFFCYQEYRARVSMKQVNRNKLKNLDDDGWDDW